MAKKEHLNLVFIGHVDPGKSTRSGRILYETGALSEQELSKLKEEAEKVGKATFEFAFAMDALKEERERGVTIDIAHKEFQTAEILLHDHRRARAPGLREEHDHRREPGRRRGAGGTRPRKASSRRPRSTRSWRKCSASAR